jgi:hypothetical protein
MYILYKPIPNVPVLGELRRGTCLSYTVSFIAEEARPYVDFDTLDATVITKELADGCKFAWAYKDTINVKRVGQFEELFPAESMDLDVEKVPYTLTESDKSAAMDLLRIVLNKEIKTYYNYQFDQITSRVPKAEKELFPAQRQEALAVKADSSASAPILTQLAEVRGITVSAMADIVLAKIEEYETSIADLLVRQKTVQKEIKECESLYELHLLANNRLGYSAYPYKHIHDIDVPPPKIDL